MGDKQRTPIHPVQFLARVLVGGHRDILIAEWQPGSPFPSQVRERVMDSWRPHESEAEWGNRDGSILWIRELSGRGQAAKIEEYPLVLIDEHNEVLYGVEALAAAKQQGATRLKCIRIVAEDHGFPPKGQRHPAALRRSQRHET